MRPLEAAEIVGRETYAAARDRYREAVIAYKRCRRVAVGESVTLVFEDRETLRFQVQEMIWIERIADPDRIQHEVDVYNELMPGPGELSATLFIEITEPGRIRPALDRLIGIDAHVCLVLGEDGEAERIRARFDERQMEEDRISAVHYLRFPVGDAGAERLADPRVPAALEIDHPHYERRCELSEPTRRALLADLTREPEPLLAPPAPDAPVRRAEPPGAGEPGGALLLSPGVRLVRPERPRAPGHVVVEATAELGSLLEVEPEQLAEIMASVRRVAAEVSARYGRCRVTADVGAGEDRLRWHVYSLGER